MFHDLADPAGLVAWLHRVTRDGTSICVTTYASSAVRVCVAAAERGVSLERVCFESSEDIARYPEKRRTSCFRAVLKPAFSTRYLEGVRTQGHPSEVAARASGPL